MNIEQKKLTPEIEQRIINYLILQSSSEPIGLLNGKMGIAIFFFHYALYSKNGLYKEIAEKLLDEIWEDSSNSEAITFSTGLTGIGWGIGYLLMKEFVQGDCNEICEGIDKKVSNSFMDISLTNVFELNGIIHYILLRINYSKKNIHSIFYKNFINKLIRSISKLNSKNKYKIYFDMLSNNYINNAPFCYTPKISYFINPNLHLPKNLYNAQLGLRNGVAGWLYNQLFTNENNHFTF